MHTPPWWVLYSRWIIKGIIFSLFLTKRFLQGSNISQLFSSSLCHTPAKKSYNNYHYHIHHIPMRPWWPKYKINYYQNYSCYNCGHVLKRFTPNRDTIPTFAIWAGVCHFHGPPYSLFQRHNYFPTLWTFQIRFSMCRIHNAHHLLKHFHQVSKIRHGNGSFALLFAYEGPDRRTVPLSV